MAVVITLSASLAVSILAGIVVAEMYHVMPKLTDWLLRVATCRLSGAIKERCYEEWRAQLAEIVSPSVRLIHAASLIARARTVLHEDIEGYFSELDAEIAALKAQGEKTLSDGKKSIGQALASSAKFRRKFGILGLAIRVAAVKTARLWTKPIIIPLAMKRVSSKISPMIQSLAVFEKALADAYSVVKEREAKIAQLIAKVGAEKREATLRLAREGDYQAKTPPVVAELRARLSKSVAEIRAPNAAATRAIQNMHDSVKAMKELGWSKTE